MEERFRLIRNMHIGRTPSTLRDLTHTSANWPLTVIGRILWLTTSLESLTLLELDQNVWYRFEHAISASLRYLALGPIHGPFHPQDLKKRPKLETFVSVLTYMRDDEVRDVVCFPSLKRFSRLLDAPSSAYLTDPSLSFAVDQAKCVSQSTNLERLEIVLCGCLPFIRQAKEATDDPRVLVMGDARNWLNVIYDEYLLERQKFIGVFVLWPPLSLNPDVQRFVDLQLSL